MKTAIVKPILFICCSGLIVGCGSAQKKPDAPVEIEAPAVTQVTIDGEVDGSEYDPDSVAGKAPKDRVIFFDFNKSEIRPEYLDIITQHGRFLAQNPEGRVRLEGHTDERGTREYNIALGESRSKTIARMLQLQGVSSAQVRSVSYGEELPVDEAHTESAWSKNRRVNVIYEVEVPN